MADLFENIGLKKKATQELVNGKEALQGIPVVALYFSAHWCPPCRGFTPMLKVFYDEVNKSSGDGTGKQLEIVFVTFDRDEETQKSYMKESHGDWLYIPHGSKHIEDLSNKFNVNGIPALIVVKSDGTVVTKDGRTDVQVKPATVVISSWKEACCS